MEQKISDLRKLRDPKFYLETFCRIKNKDGGLIPFILNDPQKDLFNLLNSGVRKIICLKARQLGYSTAIAGYFYHYTIMNPGITAGLIGYNSGLVTELLDKIKTFIRTTPKEFRPTIQYNSKYEISFPKMDSKIMILPSSENVGSGYTLNLCLITELAKWDKAEEKMTSLSPAITNGIVIVESTPTQSGSYFHRMVTQAELGDSQYTLKKYQWWWGYKKEFIDQEVKEKGERYVSQEYRCMFSTSGRSVFDAQLIRELNKNVLEVGDMNGEHKVYEYDGLRVYREPEQDSQYIIAADVSEGVDGGDYAVATVWSRKTGEEVAIYRGLLPPDRFGDKLNEIGRKYNNGLMVVESNNHGLTTLTRLKELLYPTMYFRQQNFETVASPFSDKLGWRTNKATRPLMIDELNKALREGALTPRSKELINEMLVFVYDDNGNMDHQPGFHDDCIFSAAMAWQGYKVMFSGIPQQINHRDYFPTSYSY